MGSFPQFVLILIGLFTQNSNAFPMLNTSRAQMSMPSTFTQNFDFEGIVDLSNCSGSLVQLEGAPDSDKGLILTNGHCLGAFIDPDDFIYGRPSSREFDLFKANGEMAGSLEATEIVYATMTKTDIGIYKLALTYAEIKQRYNVRPFLLSARHAGLGQQIEVISGYWSRGYRCHIEAFPFSLKEGDWTWLDSIRYSRPGCEVIGGTSGSPVIASGTRTVIGVNNTGNESGERCTDNNPCEIDEHGNVKFQEGYTYGQQVLWIYSCLNSTREVDLSLPGCQLPR